MEHQDDPLKLVALLRSARQEAVEKAARGELSEVLASSPDSATAFTYLVKLLDVHPALGKVKGRRLMADMGLDPLVRVSGLTAGSKQRILSECGQGS